MQAGVFEQKVGGLDAYAFSAEMTGINGIFRMPCIPGTTSLTNRSH